AWRRCRYSCFKLATRAKAVAAASSFWSEISGAGFDSPGGGEGEGSWALATGMLNCHAAIKAAAATDRANRCIRFSCAGSLLCRFSCAGRLVLNEKPDRSGHPGQRPSFETVPAV